MLAKILETLKRWWAMRSTCTYAAWMDRDFQRWQQGRREP